MTDHDTGRPRVGRQRGPQATGETAVTAVPRDELPTEPVNLTEFAELQSTEALLDRLARREPTEADLADPLTGLLAELGRDVDLETDASRRFRAVLAGRTAQDGQWRLEPPSTGPIPLVTGRAAAHRSVADRPRAVAGELLRSLPALGAAAAVVLAVCGGVVAAVTDGGTPPVGSTVGALSAPQTVSYQQVQEKIESAASAVKKGESGKARRLIDKAKDEADRVAPAQRSKLKTQIAAVEQSLTATTPVASATESQIPVGRTPGQTAGPVQSVPASTPTATGGTGTETSGAGTTPPTVVPPVVAPSAAPTPTAAASTTPAG